MRRHPDTDFNHLLMKLQNTVRIVDSVEFDDSKPLQTAKATGHKGERFDLVRLQEAGSSSVPNPDDGPMLVVFPNGQTDRGFILGQADQKSRPVNGPPGSKHIYAPGDAAGGSLYLPNGEQRHYGPGWKMTMSGSSIEIEANVKVTGNMEVTGTVKAPKFDGLAKEAVTLAPGGF